MSSNNWAVGDYYQFQTSTTSLSNIGLTLDHTSSNTGPRDFKVQYSTNGTTFNDFTGNTYSIQPNASPSWGMAAVPAGLDSYIFDLTGVPAVNGQATLFFRLSPTTTSSAGPATGNTIQTGGTSRLDNVTIYSAFDPLVTPVGPPIAAPVLPQAGDIAFAVDSVRSKATVDLVRGTSTMNGGTEPAPYSPWRTQRLQSVRFDNLGGQHNVQGNFLGIGDGLTTAGGSAGNGSIITSSATKGATAFGPGQVLATTGTGPSPALGAPTRLSGLSVAPNNSKIAVVGTDTGKVIVYDYTAGNSMGTGASLANARETGTVGVPDLPTTQNMGTAWRNQDTAIVLSTDGNLYEVAVTSTTATLSTPKTTLTPPAVAPTLTALSYNTEASPYVWAIMSSFAAATTTNTLYVLDPANNYSLVGTPYDFSTVADTAREIALNKAGDLFISSNGSKMYVLPNAAANAATLNPAETVPWYTSSTFAVFNGFDIGFAAGLTGDYNNNGTVDAADYVLWRDNQGAFGGAQGYIDWKANFGKTLGSGSAVGTANVPEPAGVILLAIGLAAVGCRRSRCG